MTERMVPSWLLSLWGRKRPRRKGSPYLPEEEQGGGSVVLDRRQSRRSTSSPPPPTRFLLMLLLLLVFAGTILLLVSSRETWRSEAHRRPTNATATVARAAETIMKQKQSTSPPAELTSRATASRPPVALVYDASEEVKGNSKSSSSSDEKSDDENGPYHNLQLFTADYKDMLQNFKIYAYPTTDEKSPYSSAFPSIFQPLPNPAHPNLKLGNYFSEHAFKTALFQSPLLTLRPEEAHFFYMPFSINAMRNDQRLRSGASIIQFVANYTSEIGSNFPFWNASRGSDHFYVCCHSIGREAAAKHPDLHNNAIQVTCSSSYFQRLYVAHKDVPLAQVWPRPHQTVLNPPHARNRLVFFVGRRQNSRLRQRLLSSFGNDTSMDIFAGNLSFPYEEGFQRSRYCLHVKGYEVNTARISDAIHYGCVPVIISNYYDLPFANVLDWSKFSIIISEHDIDLLKDILLSISTEAYNTMYQNLCLVRRHFTWHMPPQSYDTFFMTAFQLWLRRGLHRLQTR